MQKGSNNGTSFGLFRKASFLAYISQDRGIRTGHLFVYLMLLHGSQQWSAEMWDKAVVEKFKESSQHSVGGTEDNHEDL
jgi:hypothetical protein